MPPNDQPPRRVGPIRTAPLEDSGALREALERELKKAAAPSILWSAVRKFAALKEMP